MGGNILKYYSRRDVQEAIVREARSREVGVRFGEKGYGKRPDVLQYENDVLELAKQGATSFHISEERWKNPLDLKPGMPIQQLNDIRAGWDLCLPDFEKLLIIKEGKLRLLTFKELTKELNLEKKVGRFTAPKRISVISLNTKSFALEHDEIKDVIIRKQKPSESVIKITVEDGKEINTSPDHPILVFTKEGVIKKTASDVQNGDYLLIPKKLSLNKTISKIDLLNLIKINNVMGEYSLACGTKVSEFMIANASELRAKIPSQLANSLGTEAIPLNIYLKLEPNKSYRKKVFLKIRRSSFKIPAFLNLNKNFGKLIGYYLSEGSTEPNRVEFVFGGKEQKEAAEVVTLAKETFKTDFNSTVEKHRPNTRRVRLSKTLLSLLFKEILGFGHLASHKKIPDWVYNAPNDFLAGILLGYFIGDGHARYENNKRSLRINAMTVSRELLEGLSRICLRLGIDHNIKKGKKRNLISISGECGVTAFAEYCGEFLKKRSLYPITKKIMHPSLHEAYPPFLDISKLSMHNIRDKTIQTNLYRAIRKGMRLNKKLASLAPNKILKKVLDSQIFPIRVKKIERKKYSGMFYDLETKRNHNFLHGDGIFSHNCLDIDCKFIEYSKICAELLIEALKFHEVQNMGLKFSGGTGFHICVPFESFPETVNNQETHLLFPEGVRVIASYLKEMIRPHLASRILEISSVEEIANVTKKNLKLNDEFDPFSVIGVDAVLISSRHLFRAPYSINEKTGLVSIPVKNLAEFKMSDAKMENVVTNLRFIPEGKKDEANQLIVQAFDWALRSKKEDKTETKNVYTDPTVAIKEEFFPPCMKLLLEGVKEDGRKRGVFILINFLKKMGWSLEEVEIALLKWNAKNNEPLREGYIRSQINWHKRQKQGILPPNCDNQAYYKGMSICKPDNLCSKIKNPVQYAIRKINLLKQNEKPKKKTRKKQNSEAP